MLVRNQQDGQSVLTGVGTTLCHQDLCWHVAGEGITKCLEGLIAVGYEWLLTGVEFLDAVRGYSRPCCFGGLFDSSRAVMRFLTHQKITEIPRFCNAYLENLSSRPAPQHSLWHSIAASSSCAQVLFC